MRNRVGSSSLVGLSFFCVITMLFTVFLFALEHGQKSKSRLSLVQQKILSEIDQLRQKVVSELVLVQSKLSGKNSIPENNLREADLLSRTAIQLFMAEGYLLNENFSDAQRYLKNAKEKWLEYETLKANKQL